MLGSRNCGNQPGYNGALLSIFILQKASQLCKVHTSVYVFNRYNITNLEEYALYIQIEQDLNFLAINTKTSNQE